MSNKMEWKFFQPAAAKAVGTLIFAGMAAGCVVTPTQPATHYWESDRQADTNTYKRDNSQCESLNELNSDNPMALDSEAFEAYRQCMIERGYVLRTY